MMEHQLFIDWFREKVCSDQNSIQKKCHLRWKKNNLIHINIIISNAWSSLLCKVNYSSISCTVHSSFKMHITLSIIMMLKSWKKSDNIVRAAFTVLLTWFTIKRQLVPTEWIDTSRLNIGSIHTSMHTPVILHIHMRTGSRAINTLFPRFIVILCIACGLLIYRQCLMWFLCKYSNITFEYNFGTQPRNIKPLQ